MGDTPYFLFMVGFLSVVVLVSGGLALVSRAVRSRAAERQAERLFPGDPDRQERVKSIWFWGGLHARQLSWLYAKRVARRSQRE